jgi:hypothetical protein
MNNWLLDNNSKNDSSNYELDPFLLIMFFISLFIFSILIGLLIVVLMMRLF